MPNEELGPWDPLRPEDAEAEFATWSARWWMAGGWAIDLFLGRQTRDHGDLDVLVLRRDQALVREALGGWDVHAADPPGSLRPWPLGETLPPAVHDIWCRRGPTSAWAFQLMLDDTDGDDWLFRRDHRIRRPVESLAGRASSANLAVLSPEIQLLYKSKGLRDKDEADFQAARLYLSAADRAWLREALDIVAPGHPWIRDL
ncbi:MAG TPA: hypothetical protein VEJ84_03685 [Acidimicrobiales bacterium]|nr:hypothetical protein [Acidimicrobiales bacterium]